jgi:hypothetical protein
MILTEIISKEDPTMIELHKFKEIVETLQFMPLKTLQDKNQSDQVYLVLNSLKKEDKQ